MGSNNKEIIQYKLKLAKGLADSIKPFAEAVLLEGSLSWGSITSANVSSDIDLEVIFVDTNHITISGLELAHVQKINNIARAFSERKLSGFFTTHLVTQDNHISIRFMPMYLFKKICSFPIEKATTSQYIKEYRDHPSKRVENYYQRNFFGEGITFRREYVCDETASEQLTKVPFLIVDGNKYYPGAIVDRYICSPTTLYDPYNVLKDNLSILKENIVRRMLYEMSQNFDNKVQNDPGLHKMLCRYDVVPNNVRSALASETRFIASRLLKESYREN